MEKGVILEVFLIVCKSAGHQLLYINVTQQSVLLKRFTDVSRNRDVCLQKRYRYFVSDYDPKQYVKIFF